MTAVGLLVRLEAHPGKEDDVASFLEGALPFVQAEQDTTAWFAIRLGPPRSASLTRSQTIPGARRI